LSSLAFWALLPVWGVQGLLLRRRATRLPPPPGKIRGACGEGPALNLLALGDSIIAGVGAPEREHTLPVQFARALAASLGRRVEWHSAGENGIDLGGLLARLQALEPTAKADVVLLSIGVNDVTGLTALHTWRRQMRALQSTLQNRWPGAIVLFAGLPPMDKFPLPPQPLRFCLGLRAAQLDGIAAEIIAGSPRMLHLPTEIDPDRHGFCADGFHPSAESYAIWAQELARYVVNATEKNIP